MRLTKEDVIEYFEQKVPGLEFEPEVLDAVLASFEYPVTMDTILNRHNDVVSGRTTLRGMAVTLSMDSSITELPISKATYESCKRSCILHLCDVNDDDLCSLKTLGFDALAEVTGALMKAIVE